MSRDLEQSFRFPKAIEWVKWILDNFLHTHKDLRASGWLVSYLRFQQLMALPD